MSGNHSWPRRYLVAASGAFFVCVALGASRQWPRGDGLAFQLFDLFGTLTGASTSFNYFSPEITSELRARFTLETASGESKSDDLFAGRTLESRLKIHSVIGYMGESLDDPRARRRLAAAWARHLLQKHAEARRVTVVVESLHLPSLQGAGQGERLNWTLLYRGRFTRKTYAANP